MELIPESLRRVHEDGEIVFFCGAGVSMPAGLPSFKRLTRDILTDMLPLKNGCEPGSTEALAWQAFEGGRYDEALGILESAHEGFDPKNVRERVRHYLSTPTIRTLDKHRTLARLANLDTERGRLVTTNFDDLFERAQAALREKESSGHCLTEYVAPALPPAKPLTFRGLMYLHGKLKSSPDDRQLVLTTADFGMAYMLEGWALRFSTELFRHYHVVFIGYRVEDPAMRYLVSALAAAREESPQQFKRPHTFAPYGDGEDAATAAEAEQQWKLKGITPLPYDTANDHQQLWIALGEWADDHRQGIAGRRQKVARLSQTPPTDENDPAIGEMTWALKDIEVARYFADLKEERRPKPGWIIPLEKKGLLSLATSVTVNGDPVDAPLVSRWLADHISLHDVTVHLSRWIVESLDSQEALDWALSKGAVLHILLRRQIQRRLKDEQCELRPAFRKIWQVLANDGYAHALAEKHHGADFGDWRRVRLAPGAAYATRCFLNSLRPIPIFKVEPGYFRYSRDPDPERPSDWCEIDIDLVGIDGDWNVQVFQERAEDWEGALAAMADELTTRLREAMDWLRALDLATPTKDPTFSRYPSISTHEQNGHAPTWTQLIALTRDAYDALISAGDEGSATRLVRRWQSLPYPVFRRLALYAATGGRNA